MVVTGNLKFDAPLPDTLLEEAAELRRQWGADRLVWIAASTHRGEERRILRAFRELRRHYRDLLLVLVPRHPERFGAVARLCRMAGATIALRSRHSGELPAYVDVLVGDTMGELQRLYAASDLAFVGGSLAAVGGHNLLEPCAVGVPVLFGPHMFHFEEISGLVIESGAGSQVADVESLVARASMYLEQPALRAAAGDAARHLVAENRGAVARTLNLMSESLTLVEAEAVEPFETMAR